MARGAGVFALDDEVMRSPTRPASSPKGPFVAEQFMRNITGAMGWENRGLDGRVARKQLIMERGGFRTAATNTTAVIALDHKPAGLQNNVSACKIPHFSPENSLSVVP